MQDRNFAHSALSAIHYNSVAAIHEGQMREAKNCTDARAHLSRMKNCGPNRVQAANHVQTGAHYTKPANIYMRARKESSKPKNDRKRQAVKHDVSTEKLRVRIPVPMDVDNDHDEMDRFKVDFDKLDGKRQREARHTGRDDRATTEQVLDPRTRLMLFKLMSSGVLSEINGCISTGKEV